MLMEQARECVPSITAREAAERLDDDTALFIDVRETNEIERLGTIPNAIHISRGLLEFAIDPDSPRHHPQLLRRKTIIVFCASGSRSLLAGKTMVEMGLKGVVNLEGGFAAWRSKGRPVATTLEQTNKPERNSR